MLCYFFKHYDWLKFWVANKMGSGCGSVGRAVASDIRGPQFVSSHQRIFIRKNIYCQQCWKDKKMKNQGMPYYCGHGPIWDLLNLTDTIFDNFIVKIMKINKHEGRGGGVSLKINPKPEILCPQAHDLPMALISLKQFNSALLLGCPTTFNLDSALFVFFGKKIIWVHLKWVCHGSQ